MACLLEYFPTGDVENPVEYVEKSSRNGEMASCMKIFNEEKRLKI